MIEAPRIENPRRVLVVGGGAREHAMALKMPEGIKVFVAPGNGGTEDIATNVDVSATDIDGIVRTVRDNGIEFVVVGPERPLVNGLADAIEDEAGIQVFGHRQDRMFLEGSKIKAVNRMLEWGIPLPDSRIPRDYLEAEDLINHSLWKRIVVKADGLTEGKGVVVTHSREEALDVSRRMMVDGAFGDAGRKVVLQEMVYGIEASVIGFVANEVGLLVPARDYKPIGDNDQGPNTGGMGAYAPNEVLTPELLAEINEKIIEPTRLGMIAEGKSLTGPMFFGLMITKDGPLLLEYNQRFGDPETAVQLALLRADLLKAMQDTRNATLRASDIVSSSTQHAVAVVLASEGYPGTPIKGREITGLKEASKRAMILHAGTRRGESGRLLTNGGRVLISLAHGNTREQARRDAYEGADLIRFEGKQMRQDITAQTSSE